METKYEKKSLYINWNNIGQPFDVTPVMNENKLFFEIDLFDNNPRTIDYSIINGWWQLTGNSIYTDILHSMGAAIQKNYPELF